MSKLYSYVIVHDHGSAPNPFWGLCTLTICKPDIRRTARIGDWVLGTSSKRTKLKDGKTHNLADSLVYAMKVTEKLSLSDYDAFCKKYLQNKIPKWFNKDYRLRVGDCIYEYIDGERPRLRKSVHDKSSMDKDLRGQFALLSDHFYYFGEKPKRLSKKLGHLVKSGRKHRVTKDMESILAFEKWISKFEPNTLHADPQGRYKIDTSNSKIKSNGTNICVKERPTC